MGTDTCTLMVLPRLLLFWLSDTVTELLHRASKPRMPPTQSPITHTCNRNVSTTHMNTLEDRGEILRHILGHALTWPLKDSPSKDLMKSLYT